MKQNLKHLLSFFLRGRVYLTALLSIFVLIFWQNCSDVQLEKLDEPQVSASGIQESYLKLPNSEINQYRAAFILDMSNSMFSGPCPDSIDVLIDNVAPSNNCVGPTGVDPEGLRFLAIYNWLTKIEKNIEINKNLKIEDFKFVILPFSNSYLDSNWKLSTVNYRGTVIRNTLFSSLVTKVGLKDQIKPGFIGLTEAKSHILLLWAAYSKFHNYPYHNLIPKNYIDQTDLVYKGGLSKKPSSGTSVVLPALEDLNQFIHSELNAIKLKNANDKAKFNIVFLSDGVPKPHAFHIESAAKLVWLSKDEVHDSSQCGMTNNGYCTGWVKVTGATQCIDKCAGYLKQYVDKGSLRIPDVERGSCVSWYAGANGGTAGCSEYSDGAKPNNRWGTKINCDNCFDLLYQFDQPRSLCQTSNSSCNYNSDKFSQKTKDMWGDWTLNRHSAIFEKLNTTENIFRKEFPGSVLKFKFIRVNSSQLKYQTPPGELVKNLNWIEKAKDFYLKRHEFYVVKNIEDYPDVFPDLIGSQNYSMSLIYAYLRNVRSHADQGFLPDTDGDGIEDKVDENPTLTRSDEKCLDIIKQRFGECIDFGCKTEVDSDGDGLNQCEEKTMGTDDFSADSDLDGIIDGAELIYGLNPLKNDKKIFLNKDSYSNYEHFVKGLHHQININKLEQKNLMSIQTEFLGRRETMNDQKQSVELPFYRVIIKNIPVVDINNKENEVVVILRIDNENNPQEKYWLQRVYKVNALKPIIEVKLQEFTALKLEAP